MISVLEMTSTDNGSCLDYFLDLLSGLLFNGLGLFLFSSLDGLNNIVILGNGFKELLALIKLEGLYWGFLLSL